MKLIYFDQWAKLARQYPSNNTWYTPTVLLLKFCGKVGSKC